MTSTSVENWWWGIYAVERPRGGLGPWTGTGDTFDLAKVAFRRAGDGEPA